MEIQKKKLAAVDDGINRTFLQRMQLKYIYIY